MHNQGPPPPATVVTTQQPVVIAAPMMFRETSIPYTCHFCHAQITTSTSFEIGALTWVACFFIAIVGCWFGCCFIPFCVDACKDCVHTCPNCQQVVGRYNRM